MEVLLYKTKGSWADTERNIRLPKIGVIHERIRRHSQLNGVQGFTQVNQADPTRTVKRTMSDTRLLKTLEILEALVAFDTVVFQKPICPC